MPVSIRRAGDQIDDHLITDERFAGGTIPGVTFLGISFYSCSEVTAQPAGIGRTVHKQLRTSRHVTLQSLREE